MIMGTGPGVLLVNRPEQWLGLPIVYVWGLCWYTVQLVIVVLAYKLVWRASPSQASGIGTPEVRKDADHG
jgi:hypothetical protein